MQPPLLTLSDIHLTFGRTPLLNGASLYVFSGDRVCLVGRNGSGKSTLMKIAAGHVEADSGERFVKPGQTWRYLPQDPDLTAYATIGDYVSGGLTGADQNYRVPYLLDALKLSPGNSTEHLSGGEARRAALARTLAPEPDVLMLDEPTNHLDLPAIEWLEGELNALRGALVLVSHDRRFLTQLSRRTVWVDRGETRELDQGFGEFENWRDELLEQEALDQHKLARKIHREQHWVVHGVSGRRKRNVRRLKELKNLRNQLKEHRGVAGDVNFQTVESDKSGKLVARLENVSKSFGETPILSDFSVRISRGERIGLVGPNGAGKTTLLKLIMGEIEPDSGNIDIGANVEPLVIDQKRESLNPNWTVSDAMTDGGSDQVVLGDRSVHVQKYMKDFLFLPEQVRSPIHVLSGGERGRLQLARGLRHPSNLLVLDEPTNDLDLETLDLLEELIAEYQGTVILVSHDRDFIDRIVTRTIAWDGPAQWSVYAGGYSDMLAQQARQAQKSSHGTSKRKSGKDTEPVEKSPPKTRLSYKHKFRLEQLPGDMEKARKHIADMETAMSDPELYTRDPEKFNHLVEALAQETQKLEDMETEWLELEIMRDEAATS